MMVKRVLELTFLFILTSFVWVKDVLALSCGTAYKFEYEVENFDWGDKTLCQDALGNNNPIFPTVPGNVVAWTCCSNYACGGIGNVAIPCWAKRKDDDKSCSNVNIIEDGIEDGYRMYNCFNDKSDERFEYQQGKNDGYSKACYCKQACKNVRTGLMTGAIDNMLKIIGSCSGETKVEIVTEKPLYDGRLFSEKGQWARCANCFNASLPWFQVVTGNIYAEKNIKSNVTDKATLPYLIRGAAAGTAGKNGLPVLGEAADGSAITILGGNWTERETPQTAAIGTAGVAMMKKEDFTYFQEKLNYKALPECDLNELVYSGISRNNVNGESQVCRWDASGSETWTINDREILVGAGQKKVIFVDGNLEIKGEMTNFQVAEGGYLAFIVSGDITFGADIGIDVTSAQAKKEPRLEDGRIDGVFIANGKLYFPKADIPQTQLARRSCNRQLVMSGQYVGWQGVDMRGTFAGCLILPPTTFIDYNADHPVLTVIYRPDLVLNTPSWMKATKRVITEVR